MNGHGITGIAGNIIVGVKNTAGTMCGLYNGWRYGNPMKIGRIMVRWGCGERPTHIKRPYNGEPFVVYVADRNGLSAAGYALSHIKNGCGND